MIFHSGHLIAIRSGRREFLVPRAHGGPGQIPAGEGGGSATWVASLSPAEPTSHTPAPPPPRSPRLLSPGFSISAPQYIGTLVGPPSWTCAPKGPVGAAMGRHPQVDSRRPSLQDAREINSWTLATVLGPT